MRSRERGAPGPPGLAVAAAVVGVLVGLLGMHVLSLHGVQHEVVPEAVVAGLDHHHGSDFHDEGTVHVEARSGESVAADCCAHGHGTGALMLCMALLVATGILLNLVWRGRAEVARSWRLRSRTGTSWRRMYARAGPPFLIAYSVIRC